MIAYEEMTDELLRRFPNLRRAYEEEFGWWGEDVPGQHVTYGDLLNPYLISLLEADDKPEELRRIFDFLEELANHPNARVQNVVSVTVVEQLTDKEEWLTAAWPYMGKKTREFARELAEFWGTSPNFPFR